MKKRKTNTKSEKTSIKIEPKYIMLVFIAAAITYFSYYLRFPNSWSIFISLVFLVLLLKNFYTRNGIIVLLCAMLLDALVLPIVVNSTAINLEYRIAVFAINLIIFVVVATGLYKMKKWGFYAGIIVFALAALSSLFSSMQILKQLVFTLSGILFFANNLFAFILQIAALAYIIKSKRYFQ